MRRMLRTVFCCIALTGAVPALSAEQTVEVYKNAS
jgi:hypothetical protein